MRPKALEWKLLKKNFFFAFFPGVLPRRLLPRAGPERCPLDPELLLQPPREVDDAQAAQGGPPQRVEAGGIR